MIEKIVFTFKDDSKIDLHDRAHRLTKTGPPIKLSGATLSSQFLRGVFSRASLCLPAFYYFLGSASAHEKGNASEDYPSKVAQSYSEFADLNTLTLSCRKLFDHSTRPDLTGGNFGKLSENALLDHAKHWAQRSSQSEDDAISALRFLRRFFSECSKTDTQLLQADGQLQKRIGLLKQHADRAAAHLSLESYELDIVDLAHFTAVCVIVGEIVRGFDNPNLGPDYFQNLDAASYQAAKRVFPQIAKFQLFSGWNLEKQANLYWKFGEDNGIDMLLNQVHRAIGGDPKENA